MINRVVLVGRLTRDIELRKTSSNISTCRFTVACDRRFQSNQPGAQTADFISCVAWRQNADFLARYASKGSIVGVEGTIQTGSYEGKNGKVYTTDVVCDNVRLIGGRSNSTQDTSSRYEAPRTQETFTPSSDTGYSADENFDDDFSNTPSLDISSDDLPFY
jgi:single-strand DNA-binding protein